MRRIAAEIREGSVALKLDMNNAYYRMRIENNWVREIMDCLLIIPFSFKINGKIACVINQTKELRQGDPMSPYLFLLWANAFSTLISKAALEKNNSRVEICNNAPSVMIISFLLWQI